MIKLFSSVTVDTLGPQIEVIKTFWEDLPEKALALGIRIVLALVFFLVGVQIIKFIRKIIHNSMKKASADKGAIQFMDSFVKYALYIVLIFMIASSFGVDAASIVALVGSAGVAIGLAVQGSLSNMAGGVLLLILKPFVVGDYIMDDNGHEGTVNEIQIFYTKLMTPDNKVVVLPNGNLANNCLTNVTATQTRRLNVKVSVAYDTDLKTAKQVLLKVIEEDPAVLKENDRNVFVDELSESGVIMRVICWMKKEDFWAGKCRITENIKYALDDAGIRIPLPQMDVHMVRDNSKEA